MNSDDKLRAITGATFLGLIGLAIICFTVMETIGGCYP